MQLKFQPFIVRQVETIVANEFLENVQFFLFRPKVVQSARRCDNTNKPSVTSDAKSAQNHPAILFIWPTMPYFVMPTT